MKFSMLFLYFISIIFSINCFPNHLNKDFGDGWYFHFNLGTSASLSQTISFDFQEYPNQKYVAKWRSKSTQDAWYYTARFDKWKDDHVWGFELIHHKQYLTNPRQPIKSFSISDGYNFLMLNKGKRFKSDWIGQIGCGLVFSHPDVMYENGERFYMKGGTNGFYLAGLAAQVSLQKWLYENAFMVAPIETKLTVAYSKTPISKESRSDSVYVPSIAFHITVGIGSKPVEAKRSKITEKLRYWLLPLSLYAVTIKTD